MITEIASVVGGCVFAGLTMICFAQFFSLKIPAVKPAAWQLKQESQNNFCRKHVIAWRAASAKAQDKGSHQVELAMSALGH